MTTNGDAPTGGGLTRRGVLKGGVYATVGAVTLPLADAIWAAEGKTLYARAYNDINKLDPGFYQNSYNVDVMNCIYSKLIEYKSDGEWGWELQAAESIEQVDPTRIRFKLREGIMFTGGYGEMTAEDVKFSFERVIQHDSAVKGDWGPLDRVEVEDRYTGVIVFERPFPPVWNITLPYGAGHILSKKAVMEATENGGDFGMEPPCFSGPYILKTWKPDQYHVLVRNPEWTGPAPGFDEIRIRPMEDAKAAERAYEAGDIDFTHVSVSSYPQYKANPPADTAVEMHQGLFYVWLGMNTYHPKLKDKRVRKAVQWAVDINKVIDAAYFGEAQPATGMIAPGLTGYREKASIPPAGDKDKARQYLADAGAEGLSLTIDVRNSSKWKTIAQIVQSELKQIGIDLQINVQDSGSFWTLGMEDEGDRWKDLQLIINRFSMVPDPYYGMQWFTCDQVGIWNWERFCNERFDELHRKAAEEIDSEKRDQMYKEMQAIMEESGAYRFLTYQPRPVMYRQSLIDPGTRPDGQPLYRDFKDLKG